MTSRRCKKCRRPNAWLCEMGRPCVRQPKVLRKAPRFDNARREAIRRHWLERAEAYRVERERFEERRAVERAALKAAYDRAMEGQTGLAPLKVGRNQRGQAA